MSNKKKKEKTAECTRREVEAWVNRKAREISSIKKLRQLRRPTRFWIHASHHRKQAVSERQQCDLGVFLRTTALQTAL
jgi:hypothetical protein